jgi:Zn-dependent protease/CBS domain-containing protein
VRGAFRVFTLQGIPIRIHFSFLLVLPVLAWLFGQVFASRAAARMADVPQEHLVHMPYLWGLGLAVALFVSVLVHELAHSFYALRKGGEVSDITLMMMGGVSRVTRMPEGHRHEALMALAGPVTSLGLGVLFLGVYAVLAGTPYPNLRFGFFYLGQLNIVLGFFNLLPAFPMDGGRILRAGLTGRLGRPRATRVAGGVGKVFAVLFGLIGLMGANLLLIAIAFFVYMGAEAETREVATQARLERLRVKDVMVARTASVESYEPLSQVAAMLRLERRRAMPVVEAGRVVGVVTVGMVRQIPEERRPEVRVREVAQPVSGVTPESSAWEALRELGRNRLPQLPVVGTEGELLGTLTQDDLLRALELRELEDTSSSGPWGLRRREPTV